MWIKTIKLKEHYWYFSKQTYLRALKAWIFYFGVPEVNEVLRKGAEKESLVFHLCNVRQPYIF